MEKAVALLSSCLAAFALAACGGGAPAKDAASGLARANVARAPASSISAASVDAAVAANNAFALDLYSRLRADSATSNMLTSPLSASLALTMTYAGAAGRTATEMASALHLGASAGQAIFDGQNALSQAIESRGAAALAAVQQLDQGANQPAPSASDYDLHVVNSVWGEKTETWAAPFLNTLATRYGAGVYLQDFIDQPEPARLAINGWVSSQTKEKINDLLPPMSIDSSTRMVLVNAIHLKLPWATPFDVSATAPGTFTRSDGTTVSPSFMHQTAEVSYADDGQAQIAWLALSNRQVSVVIALPHAGVDLATYEASLAPGSAAIVQPQSSALVALSLPKATFTSKTFSLKKALVAMGMVQAFDPSTADFSGMGPRLLSLSDVVQKAMIAMQETGVEAAAATAVLVVDSSAPVTPPTPVPMIVNRPYVVAIVDTTGAVLFLGHIADPTDPGSP
jgi:serpin B